MQFKKRKTGKDLLTSNEYFQASLSLSLSLSFSSFFTSVDAARRLARYPHMCV